MSGFRHPWYNQAIGLSLLILFTLILGYALYQGLTRCVIKADGSTLYVNHYTPIGSTKHVIPLSELRAFRWSGSDMLFWVHAEKHDGAAFPVLRSVSTKQFDQVVASLSTIAPFEPVVALEKSLVSLQTTST